MKDRHLIGTLDASSLQQYYNGWFNAGLVVLDDHWTWIDDQMAALARVGLWAHLATLELLRCC